MLGGLVRGLFSYCIVNARINIKSRRKYTLGTNITGERKSHDGR